MACYSKDSPTATATETVMPTMGSDPTAAGGGGREGSEWPRSARNKPALTGEVSAGHRNRESKATQIRNLLGRLPPCNPMGG